MFLMFALCKFAITPGSDIAQCSKIGFAKVLLRNYPFAVLMQSASLDSNLTTIVIFINSLNLTASFGSNGLLNYNLNKNAGTQHLVSERANE